MRLVQRVAAYGVCRTSRQGGGVVLVRAGRTGDVRGRWLLPGGGVEHGEDPAATVVREFAEETGLQVGVTGLRDAVADVIEVPHRGTAVHTVRILFDVRLQDDVAGGAVRPEPNGVDAVAVVPVADAEDLPLMPFVARTLGLGSVDPVVAVAPDPADPAEASRDRGPARPRPASGGAASEAASEVASDGAAIRRQRLGAYGVVTAGGAVLLTRLSATTLSPGRWTLPGGGIDHGEDPTAALHRELGEETGTAVESVRPLTVLSHRIHGLSPLGVAEDFHAVQVLYSAQPVRARDGSVPEPRVVEVGGTTDAAAWVPLDRLADLPLTGMAAQALAATVPDGADISGDPQVAGLLGGGDRR